MRGLKKILKIDPANLLDPTIQSVIRNRAWDVSAGTRESTLDLIGQFINKDI
jgi:hypothetical protein